MNKSIYAIYDFAAGDVVGILTLHRNDASAIRFFSDVASDKDSIVNKHIMDYELICLGEIVPADDNVRRPEIAPSTPGGRLVMTGAAWYNAQHRETQSE